MLATEACKQGLHRLCDGRGLLDDSVVTCQCSCHLLSTERDPFSGLWYVVRDGQRKHGPYLERPSLDGLTP